MVAKEITKETENPNETREMTLFILRKQQKKQFSLCCNFEKKNNIVSQNKQMYFFCN